MQHVTLYVKYPMTCNSVRKNSVKIKFNVSTNRFVLDVSAKSLKVLCYCIGPQFISRLPEELYTSVLINNCCYCYCNC